MKYTVLFSSLCIALILFLICSVVFNLEKGFEFMIIGCLALVVVADEFIILDEVKQDIKPNNDKSVNIKPHKYTSQLIQKI